MLIFGVSRTLNRTLSRGLAAAALLTVHMSGTGAAAGEALVDFFATGPSRLSKGHDCPFMMRNISSRVQRETMDPNAKCMDESYEWVPDPVRGATYVRPFFQR